MLRRWWLVLAGLTSVVGLSLSLWMADLMGVSKAYINAFFLLVSIVLAMALTHPAALHALSAAIYPSLPIPAAAPAGPVQPGSWDQALALANAAHGTPAHVITARSDHLVEIGAFDSHDHDPNATSVNPRTLYLIDTDSMRIVRVEDRHTSLFNQGHGIHAYRFFGLEWLSVSMISAVALLLLLVSGVWLAITQQQDFVSTIDNNGGKIDVLICSAGITGATASVQDYPLDSWQRVVEINLNGVFYCCRSVVPHLLV